MPRRDKQADLRRRMAEARSRLASLQSSTRDSDRDAAAAAAAAAEAAVGQKCPLPPTSAPAAVAGGGGILRKPKYGAASASTATSADGFASEMQWEDAGNGGAKDGALGSLMAGYGDSSDDDDDDDGTRAPSTTNKKRSAPTSAADIRCDDSGEEVVEKPKRAKWSSQFEERIIIDDAKSTQGVGANLTKKTLATERGSVIIQNGNSDNGEHGSKKSPEIEDEVWDEFNALLDGDEENATAANDSAAATSTKNKDAPVKPESGAGPPGEAGESTAESAPKKKMKKKKKKKKDSAAAGDLYDYAAIADVEQASYEARLGRLMLLKSKRKPRTDSDGNAVANDAEVLLPSANDFYDPGLAFRQEEEAEEESQDDVGGAAKAATEDDISSMERDGSGSAGGQVSSSARAPPRGATLAKILRERRDKARQLSSRGIEGDGANEDAVSDGRWF